MQIYHTEEGTTLTVLPAGRLDTVTAPQLDAFLAEHLNGVTELIFDLKDLEYMSSAGLRSLLSAQKKMNSAGKMTVKNPNELISEIFDITGFSEFLTRE